MTFQTLGLRDELLQAVTEMGFQTPMPIQAQAIPALLAEPTRDFVGLAQTGTGKTGAFGLPLLQKINPAKRQPQALIVCPTRELCMQLCTELRQFSRHLKAIRALAVYGGASISFQISELRRGTHLVVATPGRLLDLMQRGAITLDQVFCVVLDEADEMLNMGFQEDIDCILKALPKGVNTWMFSATMGSGVAAIARAYLHDPVEVTVGARNQGAANIAHLCYTVRPADRLACLQRLIDLTPTFYGLVFRRTRRDAQELAEALLRDGYRAEALHGDLTQAQRDSVMRRFRNRQVTLLVATDVAARGIDVDGISHIVHYDLPDDPDVYTHRSGRTARAGKSGVSLVFIAPADKRRIVMLERRLRISFVRERVPDGRDLAHRRLQEMAATLLATPVDAAALADYLPAVETALAALTREQIIAHLAAAELAKLHAGRSPARDLNAPEATATPAARREAGPMRCFEIDAGRADNIHEGAIVRLVCETTGIGSDRIGAIRMQDHSTLLEVAADAAEHLAASLPGAMLDGRPVRVREHNQPLPRSHRAAGPAHAARGAAGARFRAPGRRPDHNRR